MNELLKRRSLLPVQKPPPEVDEAAIAAIAARAGFPEAGFPEQTPPQSPANDGPLPRATEAQLPNSGIGAEPKPEPVKPPAAAPEVTGSRRRRTPTGRDHQFTTRLRQDTLDFIYDEANGRNIPVAQVIEEATEALKQLKRQGV